MSKASMRDFEILNKLGSGSFSTVFKVRRKEDSKIYALKQVKMNMLSAKEKENALNEIRILASLQNLNIVEYKDSFFDPLSSSLCLILEFCDSGDLSSLIKKRQQSKLYLTEAQIWNYIAQILLGLNSLHSLNIFHRDMKCANIFLNKGICKLGDFNVSKFSKNAFAQTQAGTPYYCSPEIWKGQKYTMKCDIWSLGCIIYEISMFVPPFQATSMERLSRTVQRGVFTPISNQRYSKALQEFIQSCLKINPSSRPSAAELLLHPQVESSLTQFSESQSIDQSEKLELLKTIKLTRNLRDLGNQLPKPKYENVIEEYVKNNENKQKQRDVEIIKEEKKFSEKLLVAQILQEKLSHQKNQQNQIVYANDKQKEEKYQQNQAVKLPPQIPKALVENNQNNNRLPYINNQKKQFQDYDREYQEKIQKHHLDYIANMRLPPASRYRSSSQRREVNISVDHKPQIYPVNNNIKTPQRLPRRYRVLSANRNINQSNNNSQENSQQKDLSSKNKIQQYIALLQQQKQLEAGNQQKRRVSLGKQILQNNL